MELSCEVSCEVPARFFWELPGSFLAVSWGLTYFFTYFFTFLFSFFFPEASWELPGGPLGVFWGSLGGALVLPKYSQVWTLRSGPR